MLVLALPVVVRDGNAAIAVHAFRVALADRPLPGRLALEDDAAAGR